MPEIPVGEPLETRLDEPPGSLDALAAAPDPQSVSNVAGAHPSCLAAWAALGQAALDSGRPVEAYAYFRVGYHRGLDRMRASGWRGRGHLPWDHPGNQGFLRSLKGLSDAAAAIGETEEAERCAGFLDELCPEAPL